MSAAFLYFAIPMREFYAPTFKYAAMFWGVAIIGAWRYSRMQKKWARRELDEICLGCGHEAVDAVRNDMKEALLAAVARGEPVHDALHKAIQVAEPKAMEIVANGSPEHFALAIRRAVMTSLTTAAEQATTEAQRIMEMSGGAASGALRGAMELYAVPQLEGSLNETVDRVVRENVSAVIDKSRGAREEEPEYRVPDELPQARGAMPAVLSNTGIWLQGAFIMLTYIGATTARYRPETAWGRVENSYLLLLPMIANIAAVRTPRHLRLFSYAWMFGVWYLCMKAIDFWLRNGGRADSVGGQGGESNFLGAITVTVAPVAFGLALAGKGKLTKFAALAVSAVFGLGVVAAGSRAAMVGLALGVAYWLTQTSRKTMALGFAFCAAGCFLVVAPESFWKRMGTILTPTMANPWIRPPEEPSKRERIELWNLAKKTYKENMWMGIGPQQFNALSAEMTSFVDAYRGRRGLNTHNTWLQMAAEYGNFGLLVWGGAFFLSFVCYRRARKQLVGFKEWAWFGAICLGLEAGAIANAATITFHSYAWYDYQYWHFILGPVALQIARETRTKLDWLTPVGVDKNKRPAARYRAPSPGHLDVGRLSGVGAGRSSRRRAS